ncbi:MAG: NAD(P)/FAD-dependent oxidoreductase [Lachnospiraceae bacterium]|nr:NAD(P)/FAD-dependent oxidoreductase [Lachnospiraceae bacterium]
MIKINQIKMPPGYRNEQIKAHIAKQLHLSGESIKDVRILKESIDARKKPDVFYTLSVVFSCDRETEIIKKYSKKADISFYEERTVAFPKVDLQEVGDQPVVIGAGPAGLFCAYYLAKAGLRPVLLERGKAVESRMKDVERFWETGILDRESNVQFGEGGAGTFSDGKLNTLNKDPLGYQREILSLFVQMGADPAVLYEQKPHLGTDKLVSIVRNLRQEIIRLGGEVRFEAKVTDILLENCHGWKSADDAAGHMAHMEENEKDMAVRGIVINGSEKLFSGHIVLAIGHSARDTFSMLSDRNFPMEAKAFAVGYRVQHPQRAIDISQYGSENLGKFPPAPYKLTAHAENGRSVYSFCMCPGGYVVNSSSEEGRLCINGMSYSDRGGENANSAIIISVTPEDFEDRGSLSGMYFQRELEKKAYEAARGVIPVQRLEDYRLNRASREEGSIRPCMKGEYAFANLRGILPDSLEEAFLDGMEQFGRKIPDFDHKDTILAGIEARTSSPVRITRDKRCEAITVKGVYPCGEGAGYAGGITSAAADGLRVAIALMEDLGGEKK